MTIYFRTIGFLVSALAIAASTGAAEVSPGALAIALGFAGGVLLAVRA